MSRDNTTTSGVNNDISERDADQLIYEVETLRKKQSDLASETAARIKAAQDGIIYKALELSRCSSRSLRLKVARKLYWDYEVPAWAVTAGLLYDNIADEDAETVRKVVSGKTYLMLRMIGPIGSVKCKSKGCDGRVYLKSRSALEKFNRRDSERYLSYGGESYYCADCSRAYREKHHVTAEEWNDRERRRELLRLTRIQELGKIKSKSNLSESEMVRMYELMSCFHGEDI